MIKPRKLEWTPQQVATFWDYCAHRPTAEAEYFSNQVGRGVVSFAERVRPLSGLRVLDYGCGPGYLVPFLFEAGAQVTGLDQSAESVHRANAKFRERQGWNGAFLPDQLSLPCRFDVIFCLETIEHLDDIALDQLLASLRNLLADDGFILLTTPNSENLAAATVMCPDCGAEFHRWQHVRNWTPETLAKHLRGYGFVLDFCEGVSFHAFQEQRQLPWYDHSLRSAMSASKMRFARILDNLGPRPFPHGRAFRRFVSSHSRHNLVAVVHRAPDSGSN